MKEKIHIRNERKKTPSKLKYYETNYFYLLFYININLYYFTIMMLIKILITYKSYKKIRNKIILLF